MAGPGPCESSEIPKWPEGLPEKSLPPHPLPSFLQGTHWAQKQPPGAPSSGSGSGQWHPLGEGQMLRHRGNSRHTWGNRSPFPTDMRKGPSHTSWGVLENRVVLVLTQSSSLAPCTQNHHFVSTSLDWWGLTCLPKKLVGKQSTQAKPRAQHLPHGWCSGSRHQLEGCLTPSSGHDQSKAPAFPTCQRAVLGSCVPTTDVAGPIPVCSLQEPPSPSPKMSALSPGLLLVFPPTHQPLCKDLWSQGFLGSRFSPAIAGP